MAVAGAVALLSPSAVEPFVSGPGTRPAATTAPLPEDAPAAIDDESG